MTGYTGSTPLEPFWYENDTFHGIISPDNPPQTIGKWNLSKCSGDVEPLLQRSSCLEIDTSIYSIADVITMITNHVQQGH